MSIKAAHLQRHGINFIVFDADAPSGMDSDRATLLVSLTARAKASGLKVDKAALAYARGGQIHFYGTPDLVKFLAANGVPRWTHTVDV